MRRHDQFCSRCQHWTDHTFGSCGVTLAVPTLDVQTQTEDLLAKHANWFRDEGARRWICTCGEQIDEDASGVNIIGRHRTHQVAMLRKAGLLTLDPRTLPGTVAALMAERDAARSDLARANEERDRLEAHLAEIKAELGRAHAATNHEHELRLSAERRGAVAALRDLAAELDWVRPDKCPCDHPEDCCGSEASCDLMQRHTKVIAATTLRDRANSIEGNDE